MMNYATTERPRQKAASPTSDVGMPAVSLGTQLENAIVLGCPCPRERMFDTISLIATLHTAPQC